MSAREEVLTVAKLAYLLNELAEKEQRGQQRVYIQHVVDGVTYREPLVLCLGAQPGDGNFTWLIGSGKAQSPFGELTLRQAYS